MPMMVFNQRQSMILAVTGTLIFMFVLGFGPGISFTEDLGRHLLLGRIILETGSVPDTNLLTYTHGDFPFVNHHWLFEVQVYLLEKWFGLNGLILLKALIGSAALGLAMLAVRPIGYSAIWWIAGLLAAVLIASRSHIRPELISYLCIAIFLWSFEKIRQGHLWPRWLLLLLMIYWANSHIYFVFGIGMLGAFTLERIYWFRNQWKLEMGFLILCIAVCTINPNGFSGLLYPIEIFRDYGAQVQENYSILTWWRSLVSPAMLALPILSVLIVIAHYRVWRKVLRKDAEYPRIANYIIVIAALIASWEMIRSVPLLALTAMPMLTEITNRNSKSRIGPVQGRFITVAIIFGLNILLVFFVVEGKYARFFPNPLSPSQFGLENPNRFQQVKKLVEEEGLSGPVFSDFGLGSLVEYQIWPQKGYVDNRPEAFPKNFWRDEYYPAITFGAEWEKIYRERNLNTIVLSQMGVGQDGFPKLNEDLSWELIHLDTIMAIWVRSNAHNKEIIDRHQFSEDRITSFEKEISHSVESALAQPWWRRPVELYWAAQSIHTLKLLGRNQTAWDLLKTIYDEHPDFVFLHHMMLETAPDESRGLIREILEKQARWPRSVNQILMWSAYLQSENRVDEAYQELRRGLWFFPLSQTLRNATRLVEKKITQ